MRGGTRYGVIADDAGQPLTCLRTDTLQGWPEDQPLAALRERWPALWTLPEANAADILAVARFFRDEFFRDRNLVGIVLVDDAGRVAAILTRGRLQQALADAKAQPQRGREELRSSPGAPEFRTERDLMVTRYGRLDFPAQAPLRERCRLAVTINREAVPNLPGQIELGLTVSRWPLQVLVSLVNVQPADFLVEGPTSGVIEVPADADSAALTFTLVPQSLGPKMIRVRFEQNNSYLGTAFIHTEVAAARPAAAGTATVESAPALTADGLPPDVTILIEHAAGLTYTIRARIAADPELRQAREIDRITFARPAEVYLQPFFDDLTPRNRLTPAQFERRVRQIGSYLYDELFHEDGFKAFYWETLARLPAGATVQIVSDEPYIPWEILRPFRERPDGAQEPEQGFLCERFALARWRSGRDQPSRLLLLRVALVAPPSNLAYVQKEVEALQAMFGRQIEIIQDKTALETFLQSGQAEVLHFACHGHFNLELPARSAVILGGEYWQPFELTAEYRNFGRGRPLVFLNACDSGRLGSGLTGLDGWAEAFLKSKASFFIGPLWHAGDEPASRFATVFYQRLLEGDPVGEAMRQARAAIKQAGDATYLSYSLYAHPRLRAVRPS
jgi:hypothetical protein